MGARIGKDNSGAMLEAARQAMFRGVKIGALIIENEAKARVPVRTGFLRRSISSDVQWSGRNRVVVTIGPNAEYGAFVEFGTSRMGAQPYMRPAIDLKRGEANAAVLREVAKAIGAK